MENEKIAELVSKKIYNVTENETDFAVQLLIEKLCNEKTNRIYADKLTFRGYLYLFRKFLENDNRFTIHNTKKTLLTPSEYIKELNGFNLNYGINGAGEICYRDMEIMGLGTALFRTKLTTKFYKHWSKCFNL